MKYTLKEVIVSDEIQEHKLLGFTFKAKTDIYVLNCEFYDIDVTLISGRTNWFLNFICLKIDKDLLAEYLETAEFPLINLAYDYSEFVNDMIVGYKKYVKQQKKKNKRTKKEVLKCY